MQKILKAMASAAFIVMIIYSSHLEAKEQRVALVIGNASYSRAPLANPINDARDMSAKLRSLGFEVIERENIKMKQIGSTLNEFRSKIKAGSVALVFYAGHGVQIKGENYLPAVDAEINVEEDVPNQSIAIKQIMDILDESKTRLNLVFLDACRDNPYSRSFRSTTGGLAKVIAPSGTLISYATRPGSVAIDGDDRNGLYTSKLLKQLDSTQPIELSLKTVVSEVKAASFGKQEPWMEGSIEGEFCFAGCTPIPPASQTLPIPAPVKPAPQAVIVSATPAAQPVSTTKYAPVQTQIAAASVDNWQTMGRYRIKNDLVEDPITGVMWTRCSLGQHWSNSNCEGKAVEYDWNHAMLVASNYSYAGYSDWRLPTIEELKILVHCSSGKTKAYSKGRTECDGDYATPTIMQSVFPQTPLKEFWSSSPYESESDDVWNVSFQTGYDDYDDGGNYYYAIRLVRSSKSAGAAAAANIPAPAAVQPITPASKEYAPLVAPTPLNSTAELSLQIEHQTNQLAPPPVQTTAPQPSNPIVTATSSQPAPNPASLFVSAPFTAPQMVAIKGGCFQMGSPTDEEDRRSNEKQHKVCVKNFDIGKHEVTQAQWQALMGNNPSHFKGDFLPVEQVSWHDVQNFIQKLNEKTGKKYRLPTEAEWEYAARAGTSSPFYTGECINANQANYDGNHEYVGCEAKGAVTKGQTKDVGSYIPNKWGLYDMAGNVWEWTCSTYATTYNGNESKCSATDTTSERVVRGGSWNDDLSNLRSAYRGGVISDDRGVSLGFRLLKSK